MKITGNEPVFPDPARGAEQSATHQTPFNEPAGLTIRQQFAMAAMQGFLSNPTINETNVVIANLAVENADALIAELNKTTQSHEH